MAKKATTTSTTSSKATTTSTLRIKDAADKAQFMGASGKGASSDGGIGNKAVGALRDANGSVDEVKALVAKLVKVLDAQPDNVQRAALLCCASDFTLDSLVTKATQEKTFGGPKMGERDNKRKAFIAQQFGDDQAALFEQMLLASKRATKGTRATGKGGKGK